MDEFTAIPVGQGDAFLLARENEATILVDGGRSQRAFPAQVASAASSIDVVVCTHADADHAEGLIGLLEQFSTPVKEVWLPGRWTSRLPDLLGNQDDFFEELIEDIVRVQDETTLEEIAEKRSHEEEPKPKKFGDDSVSVETVEAALDNPESNFLDSKGALLASHLWCHGLRGRKLELFFEAIATEKRIRDVVRAAHDQNVRIRWFDFELAQQQGSPDGGESFLRPLNSRELTAHAVRKLGALDYLALSVSNRESLVFLSPESEGRSAVLFTADSDLASVDCSSLAFASKPLMTTPHHGSSANKAVYPALTQSGSQSGTIWVRSDGNYKKRPCSEYLKLSGNHQRACTLCRGSARTKQPVLAEQSVSGWVLKSPHCCCK